MWLKCRQNQNHTKGQNEKCRVENVLSWYFENNFTHISTNKIFGGNEYLIIVTFNVYHISHPTCFWSEGVMLLRG